MTKILKGNILQGISKHFYFSQWLYKTVHQENMVPRLKEMSDSIKGSMLEDSIMLKK